MKYLLIIWSTSTVRYNAQFDFIETYDFNNCTRIAEEMVTKVPKWFKLEYLCLPQIEYK